MQPQISPGVEACGNLACTNGRSPYKASVEASMLLRDVFCKTWSSCLDGYGNGGYVPLCCWDGMVMVVLLMLLLL